MPYTGNIMQEARYPTVAMSASLHTEHTAGSVPDDADLFGGSGPAGPGPDYGSPGLWVDPSTAAPQTTERPDAQTHHAATAPRLTPPRLGWVQAQQVARDQMMAAHSARDADTAASLPREDQFTFAGQRNLVNRQQGQRSWEAGLSGPLARGRNSYAQNNPSTPVYGGEGMRYGYDVLTWGEYRSPTVQRMRYTLRAVGREQVHFPVNTPPVQDPRPFTGFGSGTQRFSAGPFNRPRLFQPPAVTAISDVTMAESQAVAGDFASDGWG